MKNKRFLMPIMAMLIVFTMLGCEEDKGPDNIGYNPVDRTVTFFGHNDSKAVLTIKEGTALGAQRLAEVRALEVRADYDFKGWAETNGGDAVTVDASFIYASLEYFSKWAAKEAAGTNIIITYNTNGVAGVQQPSSFTVKSQEEITGAALPVIEDTDTFTFLGWSETRDGAVIGPDKKFSSGTTLYLRVQFREVTIQYDLNGFPVKPTLGIGFSSDGSGGRVNEPITPDHEVFYAFTPDDKKVNPSSAIGSASLPVLTTNLSGYKWLGWSKTKKGPVVLSSEKFTANTTLYARYSFTPKSYTPPVITFDMPYDLHPMRAAVPADWVRGADISNCWEVEQYGGKFKDTEGRVDDIMKILIDNGVNYVRLRLWVEPEKVKNHYPGDGKTKMDVIKVIAARAKAAGMKFLLAYHYSDYWADPGQQYIPVSFKSTTVDDLYVEFAQYHTDTIKEFIAAGARPDMVSLGNEIRSGYMRQVRPATGMYAAQGAPAGQAVFSSWTHWANGLDRASKAVRAIDPDIKILIQFDNGGAPNIVGTFANFTNSIQPASPATIVNVDYDIIGLSWYTYWSSHDTLDNLYNNIIAFKNRYGKSVMVCESGFAYNFGADDDVDYPPSAWKVNLPFNYEDNLSNVYGVKNTGMDTQGAERLTNANRFVSDSGIPFPIPDGRFAGNPENQARGYRAFMDAVAAAGGAGVMWWGADFVGPVMGLNSNVENSALWDWDIKALPVIKVLGGLKSARDVKPGKITGVKVSGNSITWATVNTAVVSEYKLERAASASGPWTTVAELPASTVVTTTSHTYTYTDSAASGTNFYRVSGYNFNGWGNPSDAVSN